MEPELPRILSPNLGCPFLISAQELETSGIDIVMAEESGFAGNRLSLVAQPSYSGDGKEFALELQGRAELTEDSLPPRFQRPEETRFLISTTLRSSIFSGKARFFRYHAILTSPIDEEMFRRIDHQPRPTLYDLILKHDGQCIRPVFHALCLRPGNDRLRFIHLTDLHIALRNDLYEVGLRDGTSYSRPERAGQNHFNNFNENLRRFIIYANGLADQGELEFVLILGDLVDFLQHGLSDRKELGDNNFRVFRNLILGAGHERNRAVPNPGLKVPIFTSTGNHDWRFYPYEAALMNVVYGVDKEVAQQFDFLWSDEQEEITRQINTTYERLVDEGTPISNRTLFGWLINVVLRTLGKWQVQLLAPLGASAVSGFLSRIPWVGKFLEKMIGTNQPLLIGLITLVLVPIILSSLAGLIKWFIRKKVTILLAIDAGWQALQDYFLTINPYFNYAFHVGGNYFLVLDTGHDCLRAQYLWDEGDKKLGPLSVRDNLIGGAPDSMAFYGPNEYYPFSQISWLDQLLQLITQEAKEGKGRKRIILCLHASPLNLSLKEKQKADRIAPDLPRGVLLPEGQFEIRYGTVNHYLSQFLHLCLGRIEEDPRVQCYHPVDVVLAGHAHWKLEFRLEWDLEKNRPTVYYGDFTQDKNRFRQTFEELRPFLLQTPAVGPREEYSPEPPYFRRIEIDEKGNISTAEVLALRADRTVFLPKLSS